MAKHTATQVEGTLTLTSRGFGFVEPDRGASVLIPFDHLHVAASGDRVLAEYFPDADPEKPAGKIVGVVQRGGAAIIGRIRKRKHEFRVYPEDDSLPRALTLDSSEVKAFVARQQVGPLNNGDVVRAELTEWSDPKSHPRGKLTELIARSDEEGVERRLIALARGFSLEFPHSVEAEAASLAMPQLGKLPKQRADLRTLTCLTIDPETARDFDDALSIRVREDGLFELGVHIADVSAFVREGGAIDEEAWRRGTSVYLVDQVLPMLPERLSNGLCSLVPGEPRLAFSVLAALDSSGEVHELEITESVIKSARRFTYREVEAVLHGGGDPLARELRLLHLIAQMLSRRRREAGSVDLDLPSVHVKVDEHGVPVAITPSERLEANRLVEECMLLANRLIAEYVGGRFRTSRGSQKPPPFIYRVHDQPPRSDVDRLLELLGQLGIRYRLEGEVAPEDYRNILAVIENLEFKDLVERLALKSLTKAIYDTDNRGHFGLGFAAYTHFTSPIRRYPDLVVHRLLKRILGSERIRASRKLMGFLDRTCEHASERERAATDAERDYTRLVALEYLRKRIGREFEGVVSGVTSFGIFVEINRYLVEGLVHISTLGKEHFTHEKEHHRLIGGSSGTVFRLGDRVRVRVTKVNPQERKADLELVRE